MKKNIIHKLALAAIMAAGTALGACSGNDDNPASQETLPQDGSYDGAVLQIPIRFTAVAPALTPADAASARAIGSGATRAIATGSGPARSVWAEGDEVVVQMNGETVGSVMATSVSNDGTEATFEGFVWQVPEGGERLTLSFHQPGRSFKEFMEQDGSPGSAAWFMSAEAEATVASPVDYPVTIEGGTAVFTPTTALVRLQLSTGSNRYHPTTLAVTTAGGDDFFVITPSQNLEADGGNVKFYLALPDVKALAAEKAMAEAELAGTAFDFFAANGIVGYDAAHTGYNFEAGRFYDIELKPTNTFNVHNYLNKDGSISNRKETGANPSYAQVVYVGRIPNYCKKFLAIALESAGEEEAGKAWSLIVPAFADNHPITYGGKTFNKSATNASNLPRYDVVADDITVTSATATTLRQGWRLPTVTDWRYAIWGLTSSQVSATDPEGIGDNIIYYKDREIVINGKKSDKFWTSSVSKRQSIYWCFVLGSRSGFMLDNYYVEKTICPFFAY